MRSENYYHLLYDQTYPARCPICSSMDHWNADGVGGISTFKVDLIGRVGTCLEIFWTVGGWTNPLKNMLVKLDHVPKVRGENKEHLKPPPRFLDSIMLEKLRRVSFWDGTWVISTVRVLWCGAMCMDIAWTKRFSQSSVRYAHYIYLLGPD